jgi:hypothetical protein
MCSYPKECNSGCIRDNKRGLRICVCWGKKTHQSKWLSVADVAFTGGQRELEFLPCTVDASILEFCKGRLLQRGIEFRPCEKLKCVDGCAFFAQSNVRVDDDTTDVETSDYVKTDEEISYEEA